VLTVSIPAIVKALVNVWLVNWKYIRKHGKRRLKNANVQSANAKTCIQTPNGVKLLRKWNDAPQERAYGNFQTVKKGV